MVLFFPFQVGNWAHDFKIPDQFSLKTMAALKGKNKLLITKAVCREIVSSVSTLIMLHTITPTQEDRAVIAAKLVTKYPILVDGFGCGFVSSYILCFTILVCITIQ